MDLNENVIQLSGIQKELWRMVAAAEFMLRAAMSTGTTTSLTRTFFFECDYSEEDYMWYNFIHFSFLSLILHVLIVSSSLFDIL